jgi:hypothetical protein
VAPKNSLNALPLSSDASCSPGMNRTSLTLSAPTISLNSVMRWRRSRGSSVVCVKSPVNMTKSGGRAMLLTAATAFFSVPSHPGLTAAPSKPQWQSESCTK